MNSEAIFACNRGATHPDSSRIPAAFNYACVPRRLRGLAISILGKKQVVESVEAGSCLRSARRGPSPEYEVARARDAVWLLVACACGASIGLVPVLALGILPGGGTEHAAPVRFAVARAGVRSDSPSKLISVPAQAGRATLRLHRTPAINSRPTGLIGDGHSGYWFTEQGSDMVRHVSEGGHFREYRVPTKGSQPVALALDASGNVWFTELTAGKLGRIDSGGHISEFALRYSSAQPYALALRRS